MNYAQNLPVNRPTDYVSKFITYTEALGRLVVAGVDVAWENKGGSGQIIDKATEDVIGFCYRDGSSWKIKAEHVDDYIEAHKAALAKLFKGRKPFQHGEPLVKNSVPVPGLIPVESMVTFYHYLKAEDRKADMPEMDCVVVDERGNQILCDSNLLDRA